MNFKKIYLYSMLSLVFLIVINQAIIQYLLFLKKEDAKLINTAGRQRMLSQRINLMAYRLCYTKNDGTKTQLKSLFVEWKNSYTTLMYDDVQMSIPTLKNTEILVKIKNNFKKIEQIEIIFDKSTTITEFEIIKLNNIIDLFLSDMEVIVSDLENLSNQKLLFITIVELLVTLISLVFIYFEYKKIFLPILEKLSQDLLNKQYQMNEITQRNLEIQKKNEILKQIAWQQSHELRKPVANILGLCDLLKNYQNETEEMKIKYIDYVLQSINELDEIVHKIVLQANESEYNK